MSAATAAGGAGAPPPPPPGGGGDKRKPGGGKGGRPAKAKKSRPAKNRGRPLQAMERMTILNIWYQLSTEARRSLWETLGGMLGETPALAPSGANAPNPGEIRNVPHRVRVWERPILRDVPLFQEFGQMTARARREDEREIPRLISTALGVVARGQALHFTDGDITAAIIANLGDIVGLRGLFGGPPPEESLDEEEPDDNLQMKE